ncbi:MAG: amidohydrolase family protein [Rudanella sp.]|nr:amidohydrolase family protein [Rudanella sp.]
MKNPCLTVLAAIACLSGFAQHRTLLHCGKLLDGVNNSLQPEMTVVVEGNKITSVQRGYVVAAGTDRVVDLKSKTVLPGLIDMHVHIESETRRGGAYKAGVKIAFGTDAGVYPHGMNAREFEFMVEGGMSPLNAIKAATMVNAELLGMKTQLGSVEMGKFADLIAVDESPLQTIKTLQTVWFVMKEGKIYKQ